MKRRATEAEQRLRKERRGALRQSFDEQAEELSDALERAELAEQRLGERPADDETEKLKRRLKAEGVRGRGHQVDRTLPKV